jgi:hypothetical protein
MNATTLQHETTNDDETSETNDEQPRGTLAGASCTYSPEDNKLRLSALHRLDAETYARVKAAGY